MISEIQSSHLQAPKEHARSRIILHGFVSIFWAKQLPHGRIHRDIVTCRSYVFASTMVEKQFEIQFKGFSICENLWTFFLLDFLLNGRSYLSFIHSILRRDNGQDKEEKF